MLQKSDSDQYVTKDERQALQYYEMLKAGRPDQDGDEEMNENG